MPPDTRLRNAAQQLLARVAADLTARGIDVPTRRFITTGEIVHDFAGSECSEAFIVTWNGTFQGIVSQETGNLSDAPILCAMPLTAQFTIALLRCVPVVKASGQAPTAADLQTSGVALMLDAMTLPVSVVDLQGKGELVDRADLLGISAVQPIGPEGGVGGVALSLVVTLF